MNLLSLSWGSTYGFVNGIAIVALGRYRLPLYPFQSRGNVEKECNGSGAFVKGGTALTEENISLCTGYILKSSSLSESRPL